MADGGFIAQPADLQSTAPQYDAVAQQIALIHGALTQGLQDEGACWGGDAQGSAFGAMYCGPALSVLRQMGNTNDGVQSMVDGICSWAKNFVAADQGVVASAQQFGADAGL